MDKERKKEEEHLKECYEIILKNIDYYQERAIFMENEVKNLYDHFHSDNPELYNELMLSMIMEQQMKMELKKNSRAKKKPYFGRIDYRDKTENETYSLYLGKNGVTKDKTEILIVDWRAPISSIYYECQVGEGFYQGPEQERREVTLNLKRTYEVEEDRLIDFYDSEVVANDELLTKYLAKNKEAVLGEIIATIQKEQNEIIRQTPYKNVLVQGVAGSGKTTVAMHRISYILYNYPKKFKPEEFYIIGSNKMLLNYITGVLPDLDVYQVNQMVLEEFFQELLERDFQKKDTILYQIQEKELAFQNFKGSLEFLDFLEEYLQRLEKELICTDSVWYKDKELYTQEAIMDFLENNPFYSIQNKILMLNKRIVNKVKTYLEMQGEEKEVIRKEGKNYQEYFGEKKWKKNLLTIYTDFLQALKEEKKEFQTGIVRLLSQLSKRQFDLYDLAALVYIRRRVKMTAEYTQIKHIVIDEAQDFGVIVFGVMKRVLPDTTFTIMGDVSQNIYNDLGMNDWEDLTNRIFSSERDSFYILAKSYRNTVEISKFAEKILKKCSFPAYQIEPIIRHGKEVLINKEKSKEDLVKRAVKMLQDWEQEGYETMAVICRDKKEAEEVTEVLKNDLPIKKMTEENAVFIQGIMVLPIYLTKGLEFDTVLLWNPTKECYPKTDGNGKLLYVAATRALHELGIVVTGELSMLLEEDTTFIRK